MVLAVNRQKKAYFARFKLVVVVVEILNPIFATIEKFQWFSKAPSPLNEMVRGNH